MAEMAPDVKSVLRYSWRVMEMPAGLESLPEMEKEELEKPPLWLVAVREKDVSGEMEADTELVSPNRVTEPDREKENLPLVAICRAKEGPMDLLPAEVTVSSPPRRRGPRMAEVAMPEEVTAMLACLM
jgi:hypothetical protein